MGILPDFLYGLLKILETSDMSSFCYDYILEQYVLVFVDGRKFRKHYGLES